MQGAQSVPPFLLNSAPCFKSLYFLNAVANPEEEIIFFNNSSPFFELLPIPVISSLKINNKCSWPSNSLEFSRGFKLSNVEF